MTFNVLAAAIMVSIFTVPLVVVSGIIMGKFDNSDRRTYHRVLMIAGLCVVIGISGIILINSMDVYGHATQPGSAIAWIMFTCAFVLIAYIVKKDKNEVDKIKKQNEIENKKNQLAEFYKTCIENRIYNCKSKMEKQKATLIATNNKIEFSDIVVLFNKAKQCYQEKEKADTEKARQKRLAEMKVNEQSQFNSLNEFASYSGRDKRIAMLTKEYNEVSRELQTFNHLGTMLLTPQLEKEHDWAIMGGLANGLAGPGAGIATAVNAQIENAQIRARNEARWKNSINQRVDLMSAMVAPKEALENKQAELESKIEKAKISLVAGMTPQQCLDVLTVENPNVDVSETGTCTVDTKVSLRHANCYIFEDVKATIDGTIQAEIFDGNQKIGTANLVLPIDGIPDNNLVEVKGMCLFCGQTGKRYKVKFKADNLWAMEQMEEE